MLIRHATPVDASALRELYTYHLTQTPPEEKDLSLWRDTLSSLSANPDYHLLVGEEDGTVVSSVTLIVIPNLTHGIRPYAVIENVVTHSEHRGRGHASALLSEACRIAGERGCYKVMLMTGSKDEGVLSFYEKCGFDRHAKTAFLKKL